jgi:hypothetical protein
MKVKWEEISLDVTENAQSGYPPQDSSWKHYLHYTADVVTA